MRLLSLLGRIVGVIAIGVAYRRRRPDHWFFYLSELTIHAKPAAVTLGQSEVEQRILLAGLAALGSSTAFMLRWTYM